MLKLNTLYPLLFVVILIIISGRISAQSEGLQYVFRNWNNQKGLPQNTVNDILYDNEGYLWAATEEGVVRFDGSEFTVRNEYNTPGLYSSVFYDLCLSENGIWAGSRNTVLHIADKRIRSFDMRQHLHREWIKSIHEDPSGRLWIGTSSGKLLFIENDSVRVQTQWSNERPGPVDFMLHYDNKLFIATIKGLFQISNGQVQAIKGFNDIQITTLANTKNGELWVGTSDEGIFRLSGSDTTHYKDGLNEPYINSIAEAPDGSIWIGTRSSGFQILAEGRFITPDQKEYGQVGIKSILPGENNIVWLGTNSSGLVQIKPAQIQQLPAWNILSEQIILPIYQHKSGEIWLGTAGKGVSRIKNGSVTNYSSSNGLSNNLILSLYGSQDHIYVGTTNGLNRINRLTGKVDKHYSKKDGLVNNTVSAVFYDSKQTLWITTRPGGVNHLKNGVISRIPPLPTLRNTNFMCVFEDSKNNIWLGSRGAGAIRINDAGMWELFHQEKQFPANIVFGFFEDNAGYLWMATEKGLVCYSNNRFTLLDKSNGLRFNEIYQILPDDKGFLWLSGNFGLQRVAIQMLQEAVESKTPVNLSVRLFNTVDGMANAETNGGIFPAGWKMQDGSLWFPTTQGVSIINTKLISEEVNPVNIHLQSIRYANKEFLSGQEAAIPAGVYNIEINYSSIDFIKANDIKYHYRLKGLSDKWISAGDRRVAYFSELRPGRYTFEAKAEQYGQWSDTARWQFTVKPHLYQTLGFRIVIALMITGLIVRIIYSIKQKQKRKLVEQKKIIRAQLSGQEKERQFIGSELHDNINQRLATAKLYLDFAKSNDKERLLMIEKGEKVIQNVINDIRSMCKSLIPPTMKDIGLTEALQELMGSYRTVKKFDVHFDSTALLDQLEEDLRFSLFRIVQEQLNNIANHAEARNVWVVFRYKNETIELRIEDDGKGFDMQKPIGGRGLGNIRQRLELFEGSVEIQSAPGEGCTLHISIPYKPFIS